MIWNAGRKKAQRKKKMLLEFGMEEGNNADGMEKAQAWKEGEASEGKND